MFYINRQVTTEQRFDLQRYVGREEGAYEIVNSYLLAQIRTLPVVGIFTILMSPYRPDLISYAIYNDTQYWPYLLEYNDILELTDLKIGVRLNYFSLDRLEEIYLTLSSKQAF